MRTREYLLLKNKLTPKNLEINTDMENAEIKEFYTDKWNQAMSDMNSKSMKECRTDLEIGLQALHKLNKVNNEDFDHPVAFASNSLYVLARNGLAKTEVT